MWVSRLKSYARLMRWHRPIGIFLLLWPTLWALWIASQGRPDWKILAIFVVGCIVMRSAGCVINDITDRKFDGYVKRTQDRPLVTGELNLYEAYGIFAILCLIALGLVLLLNPFTFWLSFVGLGLAILYPFMKRYTYWPQLFLGAAYAWSIPMAFAAQTNHIPPITGLIFLIALIWTLVYDTLYAMVDREDDLLIGVKSTAILFGENDRLIIGLLQCIVLLLLIILGLLEKLGIAYYISLIFAGGLNVYQQYLIRGREPAKCFKAFLNNNWFGLVIWIGLVLCSIF